MKTVFFFLMMVTGSAYLAGLMSFKIGFLSMATIDMRFAKGTELSFKFAALSLKAAFTQEFGCVTIKRAVAILRLLGAWI